MSHVHGANALSTYLLFASYITTLSLHPEPHPAAPYLNLLHIHQLLLDATAVTPKVAIAPAAHGAVRQDRGKGAIGALHVLDLRGLQQRLNLTGVFGRCEFGGRGKGL